MQRNLSVVCLRVVSSSRSGVCAYVWTEPNACQIIPYSNSTYFTNLAKRIALPLVWRTPQQAKWHPNTFTVCNEEKTTENKNYNRKVFVFVIVSHRKLVKIEFPKWVLQWRNSKNKDIYGIKSWVKRTVEIVMQSEEKTHESAKLPNESKTILLHFPLKLNK